MLKASAKLKRAKRSTKKYPADLAAFKRQSMTIERTQSQHFESNPSGYYNIVEMKPVNEHQNEDEEEKQDISESRPFRRSMTTRFT